MDIRSRLKEYPFLLPALVGLAAAIPCFSFGFLWDDYQFLNAAMSTGFGSLLPASGDPYYRPVSRGAYFLLILLAGDKGPILGHVLNAIFLAALILLFVFLVVRLVGKRAGVSAGAALAALGATPFLVAWVSGDQDLLGVVFLLVALHFQLSRKTAAAVGATALSLLSKETAIVLVPVLAALDWILDRRPYRIARRFVAYGALVVAWVLVHPGLQRLLEHGLRSGATGYLGAESPGRWVPYLGLYVLTLLNIPTTGIDTTWIAARASALLGAALLLWLCTWALPSSEQKAGNAKRPRASRVALLGGLLAAPPLLLTSTMLRFWAPYYAVFPAVGSSILIGQASARMSTHRAAILFTAFLLLGFWCRSGKYAPVAPTEQNLSVTSAPLRKVEKGFKTLEGALPKDTQVLVSVRSQGMSGLHTHMYFFQALRVWYREPTLVTLRPDWRRPSPRQERLFWISPELNVAEIDLSTRAARAIGWDPDYTEYQKTMRYYARGLATTGQTDAALHILLGMPERDFVDRVFDRRFAAMLLYAQGQDQRAESVLVDVPSFDRGDALACVQAIQANPTSTLPWDDAAFRAFDLAVDDLEAWRQLMRWSNDGDNPTDGIRFAQRVLRLQPGDPEALATIRRLSQHPEWIPLKTPGPPDLAGSG